MFIKDTSFGRPFSQKIKIFKDRINDKVTEYLDESCRIILPEALKSMPLATISWLLAIATLHRDIASIDLDSAALYEKAKSINRRLYSDINGSIYLPLFSRMRKEHKVIGQDETFQFIRELRKHGVIGDKDIFKDLEGKDDSNFQRITISLAMRLILKHSSLIGCISNKMPSSYLEKHTDDDAPVTALTEQHRRNMLELTRPSKNCSDVSEIIRHELEEALLNKDTCPSTLNKKTLWKASIIRCETSPSCQLERKSKSVLQEKNDGERWDKDRARYHMEEVIRWFNKHHIRPQ